MPSTVSRRHVLALCGTGLLAGCGDLPAARDIVPGSSRVQPRPFLTEPTDWPLANYDAANTNRAPEAAAPSGPLSHEWTYPLDIAYADSPVVADGTLYVSCAVGGHYEPIQLRAIDVRTGTERWRRSFDENEFNGHVLAVGRETVFFDAYRGGESTLFALSAVDGRTLWSHQIDLRQGRGVMLADGLVHVAEPLIGRRDGDHVRVAAYEPTSGERWWTRTLPGLVPLYPSVGPETICYPLFSSSTPEGETDEPVEMYALDPATGETKWTTSHSVQSRPPIHGGLLFTTDGQGTLSALELATGQVRWSDSMQWQHEFENEDGESRVVNVDYYLSGVDDDTLLVHEHYHGIDQFSDRIRARDPKTGEVRWTIEPSADDSVVFSTPTVAGDTLYATETTGDRQSGTLQLYDTESGEQIEAISLGEDGSTARTPTEVSPIVADGRLFVVTREGIRSFTA